MMLSRVVPQLYVFDPPGAHEPPKQLKGYTKVMLRPGQSQVVTLRLNKRSFSYWNVTANGWRVARGCYQIRVGGSSVHLPLHATIGRGGATCG